jgi:uncharacterized membrane protein YbhN (UPF0104 family)
MRSRQVFWERMNLRWMGSIVMGMIFGLTLLALLVGWAGLGDVWSHININNVNLGYLFIYFGLAIAIYVLRAWRFQLLIGCNGSLSKLYGVVSVHTLMINLFPASTGEISYPLLLKHYGISARFMDGIPSIVAARFQDLIVNACLVIAAVMWVGGFHVLFEMMEESVTALTGISVITLAIGVAVVYTLMRKSNFVDWASKVLLEILTSVRKTTRIIWVLGFALSIATRLASIVAVFYLILAVNVFLALPALILISSFYVFLPLLPVNTLAGLGISEGFLVMFFMGSGIEKDLATAASIQIHLLQLTVAALLGVVGILLLQFSKGHIGSPWR